MLGCFWVVRGRNLGIRGRLRAPSWGEGWKWVRKDIRAVPWDWKGILGKRQP